MLAMTRRLGLNRSYHPAKELPRVFAGKLSQPWSATGDLAGTSSSTNFSKAEASSVSFPAHDSMTKLAPAASPDRILR
jgi:hypothetical protein